MGTNSGELKAYERELLKGGWQRVKPGLEVNKVDRYDESRIHKNKW